MPFSRTSIPPHDPVRGKPQPLQTSAVFAHLDLVTAMAHTVLYSGARIEIQIREHNKEIFP